MRKQHGLLQRAWFLPSVLALIYALPLPLLSSPVPSSDEKKAETPVDGTFPDRLAFYLDRQSRDFLEDLAVREKLLVEMLQNIRGELRRRGQRAVRQDELGYKAIYAEADSLSSEYENELRTLVDMVREIEQLQEAVDQTRDLYTWEKLADLRARVLRAIENRELFKKGQYTEARARALVREYHAEVDSVLALYHRLGTLVRAAARRGDREMEQMVVAQMDSIQAWLDSYEAVEIDSLTDAYVNELVQVVNVLNRLQALQARALRLDSRLALQVEEVRRTIVSRLDQRLLALVGYRDFEMGPRVSELVQEWKKQQLLDYQAHFARYRAMKRSLLQSATPAERARMLQRDLRDAFNNYVEQDYALAQAQFDLLIDDYGPYFESLPAVLFYRGESYFVRNLYDEALADYQRVVSQFPDSEYLGDSLLRVLVIYQRLHQLAAFDQYFRHLQSLGDNIDRATYEKCQYLAGYVYLKQSRFAEALQALAQVSPDSPYHLTARYLFGLSYINLGDYDQAKAVLAELADQAGSPATDARTALVRNYAALKLGFLHYERGEYEAALAYFDRVSPGLHEFDQALLGAAWAHLKLGHYAQTVAYAERLTRENLASTHAYEARLLGAHAKKLLHQDEAALRDLRYVANARRILELTERYNREQRRVVEQLATLDQLESEILDRRDPHLFAITKQIRQDLQNALQQFRERGSTGLLLLEGYEEERQAILAQIAELDRMIADAFERGDGRVLQEAHQQRERLLKALDVYQADLNVRNVNYFVDYPLAVKEGSEKYRKGIVERLDRALEQETRRVHARLTEIQAMKQALTGQRRDPEAQASLAMLEQQLRALKHRLSRFQIWLADHQVQELQTDFDQWADFSGFGMSDAAFATMREKEEAILQLAENKQSITSILEQRKSILEQRLRAFEEEAQRIERKLHQEKIEQEKKNREEYFEKSYFDTSDKETGGEESQPGGEPIRKD